MTLPQSMIDTDKAIAFEAFCETIDNARKGHAMNSPVPIKDYSNVVATVSYAMWNAICEMVNFAEHDPSSTSFTWYGVRCEIVPFPGIWAAARVL